MLFVATLLMHKRAIPIDRDWLPPMLMQSLAAWFNIFFPLIPQMKYNADGRRLEHKNAEVN